MNFSLFLVAGVFCLVLGFLGLVGVYCFVFNRVKGEVTSPNSLSSVSLLEERHRVPSHTKAHLPGPLESRLKPRIQGFDS